MMTFLFLYLEILKNDNFIIEIFLNSIYIIFYRNNSIR